MSSWDRSKPVSYAYIHLSGKMLDELRSLAQGDLIEPLKLSRLDALLTHLLSAINRARKSKQSPDDVFIAPEHGFLLHYQTHRSDHPYSLTHVKRPGSKVCSENAKSLARSILSTVLLFTPHKVGAMLHDAA
jgi:hypothetical protein